jgi:acyl-CoA thioester hydrolase
MDDHFTPPAGFRFSIPLDIRFGDLDSFGHVNNAKFLTYMEQARVRYFIESGLWRPTPSRTGLIIARATVDFKLPLLLDDRIRVYMRVKRLGTKSLDSEHVIVRHDGAIAATGAVVIVMFDYEANVSIPIPQAWRDRLKEFEPALRG